MCPFKQLVADGYVIHVSSVTKNIKSSRPSQPTCYELCTERERRRRRKPEIDSEQPNGWPSNQTWQAMLQKDIFSLMGLIQDGRTVLDFKSDAASDLHSIFTMARSQPGKQIGYAII